MSMKFFFNLSLVVLFLLNAPVSAMIKSPSMGSSSSSSSSTSSTSSIAVDFVIPAFVDIMNAFEQSTPDTIEDIIEKYSPVRILFEINHKLKYQDPKKAEYENLFDCAAFAYVLLLKLTEIDVHQLKNSGERMLNILTNLTKNKFAPKKKEKRNFLEKNTTLLKIKNLHENDLIGLFAKDVQQKVIPLVFHIKSNLIALCRIPDANVNATLTQIVKNAKSKKLRELACMLGCRWSHSQTAGEHGDLTIKFPNVEEKKEENLRYTGLIKYGDVGSRINFANFLALNGRWEEAERWAKITEQEGSTLARTNLIALKANFALDYEHVESEQLGKNEILAESEVNYKRATDIIEKNGYVVTDDALALLIGCAKQNHSESIKELPFLLNGVKRYAEALHWAQVAVDKYNQTEAYFQAARAAVMLERYKDAFCYLGQYKGIQGFDYYYLKSECYMAFGQFDEARKCNDCEYRFDEPMDKSKADIQKLNICVLSGDVKGARDAFERVKAKSKQHENFYWFAQITMGTFLMSIQEYDEAKDYLIESIKYMPTESAYYHLGLYHYMRKEFDLAFQNLCQAEEPLLTILPGAQRCTHLVKYLKGCCYAKKDKLAEAIKNLVQAYKLGMKGASLELAISYCKLVNYPLAEKYFKLAVADRIEQAAMAYAVFLDHQKRRKEAEILFEQNSFEDDVNDDDGSEEDAIEEEIVAPAVSSVVQEQPTYVEVKDTKKYQRWLKEAEDKLEILKNKEPSMPKPVSEYTYADVNVTLASSDIQADIDEFDVRVKSLLSALASRVKAGKFEALSGYKKRFSMRITKADRLVFDIVDGGMDAKEGVKSIVIVSAKGHYTNMVVGEYTAPTAIKVKWSAEE